MDDDAAVRTPHRLGNRALQKRRDDKIGPPGRDGLLGDPIVDIELDRHRMARVDELDVEPLRETVERMRQQQDAHGSER